MRTNLLDSPVLPYSAVTLCRVTALGIHWRVLVQAWKAGEGWHGRLVFDPEPPAPLHEPRYGPPMLSGASKEALIDAAYELPERRLREVLHSLA